MIPHDIPGLRNDLLSAFGLLSRLPMPRPAAPRGAPAAWAWPLVGAVTGALCALTAAVLMAVGLPVTVTAAIVLGISALATGALHEDGLADTVDGLFGGWTPERRLAIMKDSQIGSYGTLALILTVLARWSALVVILPVAPWALVAAAALSRAAMAPVMASLPNARSTGLSKSVGRPDQQSLLVGAALALIVSILAVELAATVAAIFAIACVTIAVALTARARIGGQTGDILGAVQQLAELAALATFAAIIA